MLRLLGSLSPHCALSFCSDRYWILYSSTSEAFAIPAACTEPLFKCAPGYNLVITHSYLDNIFTVSSFPLSSLAILLILLHRTMPPATVLSRYGGWLPKSRKIHQAFFDDHLKHAKHRIYKKVAHEPAVAAFEKAINDDPIMTLLFGKIFLQVSPENNVRV